MDINYASEPLLISVEKTAIDNGVAKSAKAMARALEQGAKVLDFGAGHLRNTYFLEGQFKVDIIDTPLQCEKYHYPKGTYTHSAALPTNYYEGILCSYVLNVIPDAYERDSVVLSLLHSLSDTGGIWIEVRTLSTILRKCKHLEPYNDGFLVGRGRVRTFQKGYTGEELKAYLEGLSCHVENVKEYTDSVVAYVTKKQTKKGGCSNEIWTNELSQSIAVC